MHPPADDSRSRLRARLASLLVCATFVVVASACAEGTNDAAGATEPVPSSEPNEPTPRVSNTAPTATTPPPAPPSTDAGAGASRDAMPDAGPPPTATGGDCDLSNGVQAAIYTVKAYSELQKSTPRQCSNGCKPAECCFGLLQVCVDR